MSTSEDERIGLLLRTIRRRLGYSQAMLSVAAGVPREDIIRIEQGKPAKFASHGREGCSLRSMVERG